MRRVAALFFISLRNGKRGIVIRRGGLRVIEAFYNRQRRLSALEYVRPEQCEAMAVRK